MTTAEKLVVNELLKGATADAPITVGELLESVSKAANKKTVMKTLSENGIATAPETQLHGDIITKLNVALGFKTAKLTVEDQFSERLQKMVDTSVSGMNEEVGAVDKTVYATVTKVIKGGTKIAALPRNVGGRKDYTTYAEFSVEGIATRDQLSASLVGDRTNSFLFHTSAQDKVNTLVEADKGKLFNYPLSITFVK